MCVLDRIEGYGLDRELCVCLLSWKVCVGYVEVETRGLVKESVYFGCVHVKIL